VARPDDGRLPDSLSGVAHTQDRFPVKQNRRRLAWRHRTVMNVQVYKWLSMVSSREHCRRGEHYQQVMLARATGFVWSVLMNQRPLVSLRGAWDDLNAMGYQNRAVGKPRETT